MVSTCVQPAGAVCDDRRVARREQQHGVPGCRFPTAPARSRSVALPLTEDWPTNAIGCDWLTTEICWLVVAVWLLALVTVRLTV